MNPETALEDYRQLELWRNTKIAELKTAIENQCRPLIQAFLNETRGLPRAVFIDVESVYCLGYPVPVDAYIKATIPVDFSVYHPTTKLVAENRGAEFAALLKP